MNDFSNKTKLLTVIANAEYSDYLLDVMKKAGLPGCTKLVGKTQDKIEKRETNDLQCILLSIININPDKIIRMISDATLQNCNLNVMVLLFNVFDFEIKDIKCSQDRSNQMEPKMKLIATIVNRIYTEELMSAARQAGAQGGTIIEAKGTGTEEDATFFGIRLTPEKEILLILATVEDSPQIVETIKNQSVFKERGNGIVFTMNVEELFFFN